MKNKLLSTNILFLIAILAMSIVSFFIGQFYCNKTSPNEKKEYNIVKNVSERITMQNDNKWIRCFLASDGTIYLKDSLKSTDGGKSIVRHNDLSTEEFIRRPERALLVTKDLLYALDGPTKMIEPGKYRVKTWRSNGGLNSIEEEEAIINVSDGPLRNARPDEWFGIFVFKTILQMDDGSWLMTMYGNFASDTILPQGADATKETAYLARTFVVTSTDQGHTWNYLSSVAVPRSGDPVGEGFVEPAITQLNDGRLLCVMRTGHHFPLYSSWSSDGGKTWTPPTYTGLDRGCDPSLITLKDGRVALSWGRRFSEGWSQVVTGGDKSRFKFPGEGYVSLAISENGGETWENTKIAQNTGTCYSTIFEVEPNVIFCQVDRWCWRIYLNSVE